MMTLLNFIRAWVLVITTGESLFETKTVTGRNISFAATDTRKAVWMCRTNKDIDSDAELIEFTPFIEVVDKSKYPTTENVIGSMIKDYLTHK